DIEFPLPESLVDSVVIGTKIALAFSVEHADVGNRGIENLLGSSDDQSPSVCFAATIHVAIFHPAPLMCVPGLMEHTPSLIDLGRAKETGNIKSIRQPIDLHVEVLLQAVGLFLGEIRVRAFIVEIVRDCLDRHTNPPVLPNELYLQRRARWAVGSLAVNF